MTLLHNQTLLTTLTIALAALLFGYYWWLRRRLVVVEVSTTLTATRVRELFVAKVARLGWRIVDEGNPMVAQSGCWLGRRQRIAIRDSASDGAPASVLTEVYVSPTRWSRSRGGTPTQVHTIAFRMNAFVRAVRAADPSAQVRKRPVRDEARVLS